MAIDKLQRSRFERKYLIREEVALEIRDFVQSHLELDENGVGKPDFAYPVHSLYLDSDDLKLYWQTINGDKNRFKLRVRYYNDSAVAPVFFEIKRRINQCILKQRTAVRREAVETILASQMPAAAELVSGEAKDAMALYRFIELVQQIDARPKAHVAYSREAYLPHDDNSARVTDGAHRADVHAALVHANGPPHLGLGSRRRAGTEVYRPVPSMVWRVGAYFRAAAMRCREIRRWGREARRRLLPTAMARADPDRVARTAGHWDGIAPGSKHNCIEQPAGCASRCRGLTRPFIYTRQIRSQPTPPSDRTAAKKEKKLPNFGEHQRHKRSHIHHRRAEFVGRKL
jgi:hypothetical protein